MPTRTEERTQSGAHSLDDERKGAWGLIVLAVLILVGAAIAWWVIAGDEDEAVTDDTEVGVVDGAEDGAAADDAPDGVLTALADFDADPATLEGRMVDLTEVPVDTVPSDKLFTVGEGPGGVFVAVGAEPSVDGAPEGRFNIEPGDVVSIQGIVRTVPSVQAAMEMWQIDQATAQRIVDDGFYIHATAIEQVGQ